MNDEEVNYLRQLENEVNESNQRESNYRQQQNYSLFNGMDTENMVRYQIDLSEDIDRIYHLLRGDLIEEDEKGNIIFKENKNENEKPFNNFGVQAIMNIVQFYLNKDTLLSNYDEDTIYWKVLEFGQRLSDLILTRYEELGMDTPDKIKNYSMIIKELVDIVHSTYLRALDGGERDSLRKMMTYNQHENIGSVNNNQQKKTSIFKPWTW